MTKFSNLSEKRKVQALIKVLAKSFLAAGQLSDDDLKDGETLLSKLIDITGQCEFLSVIDHTDSLLAHATQFSASGDLDLATVLYAMYFEHGFNRMINHTLIEKGLSEKSKNELIRAVNIEGKCGWLLELLELPKFNNEHRKVIVEVSHERNAFVHYKWNPEPFQPDTTGDKKTELIEKARKTVSYMKRYVSRVLYKGKKGDLKKALTNI